MQCTCSPPAPGILETSFSRRVSGENNAVLCWKVLDLIIRSIFLDPDVKVRILKVNSGNVGSFRLASLYALTNAGHME